MRRLALLLLLAAGCHPTTPAEKTQALVLGLNTGIGACRVYAAYPTLPRDKKLDTYCPGIITTKETP